jgi:hypothetical protein
MPVFEGLLPPPFDNMLQDLLFVFLSWHGLAKLHMHMDATLANLDKHTTTFGTLLHEPQAFVRRLCKLANFSRPKTKFAIGTENTLFE